MALEKIHVMMAGNTTNSRKWGGGSPAPISHGPSPEAADQVYARFATGIPLSLTRIVFDKSLRHAHVVRVKQSIGTRKSDGKKRSVTATLATYVGQTFEPRSPPHLYMLRYHLS